MRVTFVVLVSALLIGMFAVACQDTVYEPAGSGSRPATSKIEILSHERGTTQFGGVVIRGKARSVSDGQLSYAEIRVRWLDAEGSVLDTSLDNINDLNPGDSWSFEVMFIGLDDSKVSSYEIAVGTVF